MADDYRKYRKLTPREHVLLRPDMYIGSVAPDDYVLHVPAEDSGGSAGGRPKMRPRTLRFAPALAKVIDEVIVNASDHAIRLATVPGAAPVTKIAVEVDAAAGRVTVTNNGDGLDVVPHPDHGVYVPELVFGSLLTSTNYDDDAGRVVGGKNGIGAKATNIFSTEFSVDTVDAARGLRYTQTWRDNMSVAERPSVRKTTVKTGRTAVSFVPDLARLGGEAGAGFDADVMALLERRAYDLCAVTGRGVAVHFNGAKLEVRDFERFADLFLGADRAARPRVHEAVGERWEVVAAASEEGGGGFTQVSYVNGINTLKGGKHVDHVATQIARRAAERLEAKHRGLRVTPASVRECLFLMVKGTVVNPAFESQAKEYLTTPVSKFGSRVELSETFVPRLLRGGLEERVLERARADGAREARKTDGRKASLVRVPKLDDANWAGTARSGECTLILTEGDSAKSMAIAGLSVVGRDAWGVFPLKGKVINAQDVAPRRLNDNAELAAIKKILGLESGREYDSAASLRYGAVLLMTDADADGSHIKGLLFNLFRVLWPSLLRVPGFLSCMVTPIVKASPPAGGAGEPQEFYSLAAYEDWKAGQTAAALGRWRVKYFKGLGTSSSAEAKQYFRDMRRQTFVHTPASEPALDLAFNKRLADDRKAWLAGYDRSAVLDPEARAVPYEAFVHRELIHFSQYDLERSVPSLVDGLKTSQRKILYACFKRGLVGEEVRVAQLAGYVSEHAAYHHGEASLQGAIVGMAQGFVGSNNLPLLRANGQFGTRIMGGKDAASPRYIHTQLAELAPRLFVPADEAVLERVDDDGQLVEPRHYVPVLPMVLVNGALGIGTAFSTSIPCYNPLEVADALARRLRGEPPGPPLAPWYRGFRGRVLQTPKGAVSVGCVQRTGPDAVRVTELPVGVWTEDYKAFLEAYWEAHPRVVKRVKPAYTEEDAVFEVQFHKGALPEGALTPGADGIAPLHVELRLVSNRGLSVTNMHLFDARGGIRKFESPEAIMEAYAEVRLSAYEARRQAQLRALRRAAEEADGKLRFVQGVIDGNIKVHLVPRTELVARLTALKFKRLDGSYDHLTGLPIMALTAEKVRDLRRLLDAKAAEIAVLEGTDARAMWLAELAALRPALGLGGHPPTAPPAGRKKDQSASALAGDPPTPPSAERTGRKKDQSASATKRRRVQK